MPVEDFDEADAPATEEDTDNDVEPVEAKKKTINMTELELEYVDRVLEYLEKNYTDAYTRAAKDFDVTRPRISHVMAKYRQWKQLPKEPYQAMDVMTKKLRDMNYTLSERGEILEDLKGLETECREFYEQMNRVLKTLRSKVMAWEPNESSDAKNAEYAKAILEILLTKHSPLSYMKLLNMIRQLLKDRNSVIDSVDRSCERMTLLNRKFFAEFDPDQLPDDIRLKWGDWIIQNFCSRCDGNELRMRQRDRQEIELRREQFKFEKNDVVLDADEDATNPDTLYD